MKHSATEKPDIYRVQVVYPWNRRLLGTRLRRDDGRGRIWPRRPWMRTWQAEWNGCEWAPRAWTERGIRRKAARWHRRGGSVIPPTWRRTARRWRTALNRPEVTPDA